MGIDPMNREPVENSEERVYLNFTFMLEHSKVTSPTSLKKN